MSRADSRRVPADQRATVVKALYAEASRLDWEHMSTIQRTQQYDRWVAAPDIGGVLTEFMSAETARSWIKDGPMKEYARAQQGAGRYAEFGSKATVTPEQMVLRIFGSNAVVTDGSLGVKPLHCRAVTKSGETYVAWGEARNFRFLVWGCLAFIADHPGGAAHIVVTETMTDPTTASEKRQHTAIANRCHIGLSYHRIATNHADSKGEV